MSVAFRRDSDEEHLEPRFELPIPPGPNLVTRRGYALIEARTTELESLLAAESGEDRRKELLRYLRYWRNRLTSAQVVSRPSPWRVGIGTKVTLRTDQQIRVLTIVGHDESDAASHRLAFSAPLARLLMGAEVGDEVALPGSGEATITGIEVQG